MPQAKSRGLFCVRESLIRSEMEQVAKGCFYLCILLAGEAAELSGKFVPVEAGHALHINGRMFRQPARLSKIDLPALAA